MKLTREMRAKIATNAVAKLRNNHDALLKKINSTNLKVVVLDAIGTKSERTKMSKLPDGWMCDSTYFYLDAPDVDLVHKSVNGNGQIQSDKRCFRFDHNRVDMGDRVRYPYHRGYHLNVTGKLRDLIYEYATAYNLTYSTLEQIYINLKSYKTVDEMKKCWPDGVKFYTGFTPATTVALAVRWESVNEVIK